VLQYIFTCGALVSSISDVDFSARVSFQSLYQTVSYEDALFIVNWKLTLYWYTVYNLLEVEVYIAN